MFNLCNVHVEIILQTKVEESNENIENVSSKNNPKSELFPQFIPKNKRFRCPNRN